MGPHRAPSDGMMVPRTPAAAHFLGGLGIAVVASAAIHGIAFFALVGVMRSPRSVDISRISPPLLMFAPDRLPERPQAIPMALPAPLGNPRGAEHPVVTELFAAGPAARERLLEGRPPVGPLAVQLDSIYSVLGVDSEVVRTPESLAPVYPPQLLAEGMEGAVEAEFVVDTTGKVDTSSIAIMSSSHEEFTLSVQSALAGMRFRPAYRNSQKVRQLVRLRFGFRIYQPAAPVAM